MGTLSIDGEILRQPEIDTTYCNVKIQIKVTRFLMFTVADTS